MTNELHQYGANIPEIAFKNINAYKSMSRTSPIQSSNNQSIDRMTQLNNSNTGNVRRQGNGYMGVSTVGKRRHSAGTMLSWEQENIVKELFQRQMPRTPPASFLADSNFEMTQVRQEQRYAYCDLNELNKSQNKDSFTNLLVFHALAKTGIHQLIPSPPTKK